mgnify:CR=1 FL=1
MRGIGEGTAVKDERWDEVGTKHDAGDRELAEHGKSAIKLRLGPPVTWRLIWTACHRGGIGITERISSRGG